VERSSPARKCESTGEERASSPPSRSRRRAKAQGSGAPSPRPGSFREIDGDDIPRDMRATVRLVRTFLRGYSAMTGRALRIVVMRRDDP
jgi:hypothetical protein